MRSRIPLRADLSRDDMSTCRFSSREIGLYIGDSVDRRHPSIKALDIYWSPLYDGKLIMKSSSELPPLTEFNYYILVSLTRAGDRGLHGYGILQEITDLTEGLRRYALPSLYEALSALRAQGLIDLDREEPESGRLRKYFRITGLGERAMHRYFKEWERIRQKVQKVVPDLRATNA